MEVSLDDAIPPPDAWQQAIDAGWQPQPQPTYAHDGQVWDEWFRQPGYAQDIGEFTGMQSTDWDFSQPHAPNKIIEHDKCPVWDGLKPESQARPYVKMLKLWMATTKTAKNQRGMVLMHAARGDLKTLIDYLELEQLQQEDADE